MTAYPVRERHERFHGRMFSVVTDEVEFPGGQVAARDYLRHVGSVAVVALDAQEQVVLIRQYRHPVGARLWELPAGLTDVAGEPPAAVARRELAEEANLRADRWDLLVDLHPSPGCSNEWIRVFLARGLSPADSQFRGEHEEAHLEVRRVPLTEAVDMVLAGQITNGPAIAGLLAAAHARDRGWAPLRPVDSPPPG